ncbi:SMEK domain-containing protein [Enterococcus sp. ALS3]|uniref:SMEK domain-containing protein n=1 Tax=Enterococcus alishanensis TaxID=1303817 RepID=A0ABS6T9L9_9ENTE|nr:ABC-three component system protein [Enterococcus alishanensis]MBV7389602.1 SMEK domain-containing protein [Enterococcus alishanensis]
MNRKFYYDYISEKIDLLSLRIKRNGKLNLLDLNVHSEVFFCGFLNGLFGYSLSTANDLTANAEAIDLVDDENHIVIQVTSTRTKNKINATLEKQTTKEYAEKQYNLKFLFMVGEVKNLKKQEFENIHKIDFTPDLDLLDTVFLLRTIYSSKIDVLVYLHDFVRKELGESPSVIKITSNLASVLNILAEKDLSRPDTSFQLNEYNIDNKIAFNDLGAIKDSTINDKKKYYGTLDRIYKEFDRQGTNKTLSVFSKLSSFYEEELLNEESSNVEKFFSIISSTTDYIKNSANYVAIPDDELELCARIIVVDAFIRCKIFKNPEDYTHVIT